MSETDKRDSRAILAAASHEVAAVQIKAKHNNERTLTIMENHITI